MALVVATGCAGMRGHARDRLLADRNPAAHARDLEVHYQVRYPDVLAVEVAGRPDCSGNRTVGLDGRIVLAPGVYVVVDALTAPRVARDAAFRLGMPAEAVRVRVEKHASQHLYLFGEVGDRHQVVAYRGPETVLDLLQRIGGPEPGASLSDVRIVRAHIADGKAPEVFHIDLDAIVNERDVQSNVRLEPFDRVHIGQTQGTRMACVLPPWLRLFNKKADAAKKPPPETPPATK